MPAGNLDISAAISFNGASPTDVLRVLKSAGIETISYTTYLRHRRELIDPTIYNYWRLHQKEMFDEMKSKETGLILGGDGRSDSPGHCAKYGSYSTMELSANKIIDIQMVQKNEVTSSNAMELEGLKRSLKCLEDSKLEIKTIVTDRHPSIQKFLRLSKKHVKHEYDTWHVAKGFKKKILKLIKSCPELAPWVKSIINHIYWSASSSKDDKPEMIVAKWLSICNHIKNKHTGHEDKLFPKCAHETKRNRGQNKKKWLKPKSKAYDAFCELAQNKRLLNDVKKLSPGNQTSNIEAFHSLINQFAPKRLHFSYIGMLTR
ncbi:unnamed protein product, partial [Meganyctiphanes norvegica]